MNTPFPRILPPLAEVTITALGGLGDGISLLNGKPVFVEKAVVGDALRIRIVHETKEHARGEIVDVLKAGADRMAAPCPHFSACGGCSLQQLSETAYRSHKRKVLKDALHHAGYGDVSADVTFLPAASRRRAEFKFDGKRLAYYASRTRNLVPIDSCLILEPALQQIMGSLASGLGSWHAARAIKTVCLTAADSGIDLVLECSSLVEDTTHLATMAETLGIARISLLVADSKPVVVTSRAPVTMQLGSYDVALPSGAFLQATREGGRLISRTVIDVLEGVTSVADLFCGIGTYSFALPKQVKRHAVELDPDMVKGLKTMVHLHGFQRHFTTEMRDLFKHPLTAEELRKFDAVILNPPRPGAKAQVEEIAKSNISKVVMVSCNPASFARDAKALKHAGFQLTSAQAIDQFVYSPHLEMVAVFSREDGNRL